MTPAAVGAALFLEGVPRLGPAGIRKLVDEHGDAMSALVAIEVDGGGLPSELASAVRAALGGGCPEGVAEREARRAENLLREGDRVVAYGLKGYPQRLRHLHHPPPVLWMRGPLPPDAPSTLAIVGTRRATRPGRELARRIAREVADRGVRVVSGLAAGIDAAAHRGALDAGGETVAVLGSGLNHRYPVSNHDLYARLPDVGLLLTEFPPDRRPAPHHFPRRNRIVAALSHAVLVVQAGRRSGALLTAGEAADLGIDVLACPGDVRIAASAGCHGLIRDGAGLVTSSADVLDALGLEDPCPADSSSTPVGHAAAPGGAPAADDGRAVVLARLADAPASLGELSELAGGVASTAALLARLELRGEVIGRPGGRFESARSGART